MDKRITLKDIKDMVKILEADGTSDEIVVIYNQDVADVFQEVIDESLAIQQERAEAAEQARAAKEDEEYYDKFEESLPWWRK